MSTPTIIIDRLAALTNTPTIRLAHGGHGDNANPLNGEACSIETGRWIHGLTGDRGPEESPAIGAAVRALNDAIRDDDLRTELLLTTPSVQESITVRAPLSRGSDALESARGWSAVDFAVRTVLPVWLDLLAQSNPGAERHALALRALDPITGPDDLARTEVVRREAREFCAAAWAAACAAAWAAAWAAACDAARAAACAAARAAACAAARDAACAAARAAAWAAACAAARAAARDAACAAARDATWAAACDAARDALAQTVLLLQRETAAWIHRMLDTTAPEGSAS